MRLSEYLLYRDITELGQIATIYDCDCNRNSKLELVQSIHHRMLNKNLYHDMLSQLDTHNLLFLTYLLFQDEKAFSMDELMAKGKYICAQVGFDTSPRQWISELLKRGWLFPSTAKYHIQLEFPEDLQPLLKRQLIQYWIEQRKLDLSVIEPPTFRDEGDSILYDIEVFLTFLRDQPIPLTIEGVMYKRYQQLLIERFHVVEEVLGDKTWRFGYGRRFPAYPNRFSLIYDYCYYKEWIVEDSNVLALSNKGEKILEDGYLLSVENHIGLLNFWLTLYKKPIPGLPFILNYMCEIVGEQWIESHQLYEVVKPWLKDYYFDTVETIFKERVIQMLVHLGVFRVTAPLEEPEAIYLSVTKMYSIWKKG